MTGDTGDDDRLAGLFRDAASDGGAPPPGFDHGDVVATSRRITRPPPFRGGRRALALFAVAGVGTVVALPRGDRQVTAPADRRAARGRPTGGAPTAPAARRAGAPRGAGGGAERVPVGAARTMRERRPRQAAPVARGGGSAPAAAGPAAGRRAARPGWRAPARRRGRAARAGHHDLRRPAGPGAAGAARPGAPGGRGRPRPRRPPTSACPGASATSSLELGGGVFTVAYLPPGTASRASRTGASSAPTASGGTVWSSRPTARARRRSRASRGRLQYLGPRL